MGQFVDTNHGNENIGGQPRSSDKENRRSVNLIEETVGMQCIQESQMEDRSFRKRQNMLSDIQAMIVDYKKKSHYSNLVTNHDSEGGTQITASGHDTHEEPRMAQTSKTNNVFEAQEMAVP